MRFPKDTPTAYFHASATDGGLGIPRLRFLISAMKNRKMDKAETSAEAASDPVMNDVVDGPCFRCAKVINAKVTKVSGNTLDTG